MSEFKLDIYCSPKELPQLKLWCQQEVPKELELSFPDLSEPPLGSDEAPRLVFSQGALSVQIEQFSLSSDLSALFDLWLKERSKRDLLARAVGAYAERPTLAVLDATFGLGKDSMNLLAHGLSVVACERNPILFLLGIDGRRRLLARNPELVGRFALKYADLEQESEMMANHSVIYLDPMFEDKNKRLAKKEMQLIQKINLKSEEKDDRFNLLRRCLEFKGKRIVFKGPIKEKLEDFKPAPSSSLVGKTVRYNLFLT